ncbi:bZIP_1 domain-containing protein [Cephalotus follicularis]|uniref:BZIP_1 domain-containing protein n=1 Tax=Cephalotus follicularis TaxID=3775 RepID=A0A1Q3BDL8_CEPFO|nr:bZIP_1 domain-containing protein [Cephalotus follicularis]
MADPVLTEQPPAPDPNFTTEFDALPIPSLDCMYLSTTDLDLSLDHNYDLDISFDDLNDLYFPTESEPFLLPTDSAPPPQQSQGYFLNSVSPESGSSGICGDQCSLDVANYLDCPSEHSGSFVARDSPVSSHGSGNCGSDVSEAPPSPDSVGEIGKGGVPKRKIEAEDTTGECRTNKYRRSEEYGNLENQDDEKRKARLMRNRESAQLSRQRKKHYVEELEDKVRGMHSVIADLNAKISFFMAENATLRQQLTASGAAAAMCPPPHPGMYPPVGHMPYPWGVPCAPYVVKPQGSNVPLVPIPRLKPQQPVSTSKPKKSDNKKSEFKIKKVASATFLGLLFFVLLFGGLVPIVNVKFGGLRDDITGVSGYVSTGFYDQHRGRVLTVSGFTNVSDESASVGFSMGKVDAGSRTPCERGRSGRPEHLPGSDEFIGPGNSSQPLAASLYVPRNDKLVKIDGNLIIHSILASERAMASHHNTEKKNNNNRETGLAIPRDLSPALAIPEVGNGIRRNSHVYRKPAERPKALSPGSSDTLKDHMKSSAADGKLQQWFREGLAGPMLSSGMCTEVFQFDVSPASAAGAIVPASIVTNTSAEHRQNATHPNRGRNRKNLRGLPVPFTGSKINITGERAGRTTQQDNFEGNKSASPMVVSVLVDPRETGDGDIDGMIAPKSLSRIFVVVLLDSVKYVTYSCVLPRSGPHLVTT